MALASRDISKLGCSGSVIDMIRWQWPIHPTFALRRVVDLIVYCIPINPTASNCSTAEADLRVLICTQLVTHNFSQLVLSRCCAAVRCVFLGMQSLQLVEG